MCSKAPPAIFPTIFLFAFRYFLVAYVLRAWFCTIRKTCAVGIAALMRCTARLVHSYFSLYVPVRCVWESRYVLRVPNSMLWEVDTSWKLMVENPDSLIECHMNTQQYSTPSTLSLNPGSADVQVNWTAKLLLLTQLLQCLLWLRCFIPMMTSRLTM